MPNPRTVEHGKYIIMLTKDGWKVYSKAGKYMGITRKRLMQAEFVMRATLR